MRGPPAPLQPPPHPPQRWNAAAAEAKAAYAAALAAAGIDPDAGGQRKRPGDEEEGAGDKEFGPVLPVSRVKRILAQDPDCGAVPKDTLLAIALATELFIAAAAEEAAACALEHKRRTVGEADIVAAVHRHAGMAFLRSDFPLVTLPGDADGSAVSGKRAAGGKGGRKKATAPGAVVASSTDSAPVVGAVGDGAVGDEAGAPTPAWDNAPTAASRNTLEAMFARVAANPTLQRRPRPADDTAADDDAVEDNGGDVGGDGAAERSAESSRAKARAPPAVGKAKRRPKHGGMDKGALARFLVPITAEQAAAARVASLAALRKADADAAAAEADDAWLSEPDGDVGDGEDLGEGDDGGGRAASRGGSRAKTAARPVGGSVVELRNRLLGRKFGARGGSGAGGGAGRGSRRGVRTIGAKSARESDGAGEDDVEDEGEEGGEEEEEEDAAGGSAPRYDADVGDVVSGSESEDGGPEVGGGGADDVMSDVE
jgi:DNA polymerase epsilon subunit 4